MNILQTSIEPLLCRGAVNIEALLSAEAINRLWESGVIMYMPGGIQTLTPSQGGRAVNVTVMVDRAAAQAVESQRASLAAKGEKPYFDLNHDDKEASFWPNQFYWSETPLPGIYAKGDKTDAGEAGVKGKNWRFFSPVFFVDDPRKPLAVIIARADAKPNMGGLVNDPAFKNILPLWAKAAGAPGEPQNQNQNVNMTPQEIAALQAKINSLEQEVNSLKAKAGDADSAAVLKVKEADLKVAQLELQNAELQAKNADQAATLKAHNEKVADDAIATAVARGAIAAKDETTKASWKALIGANPANAELLAKMAGNPALSDKHTTTPVIISGEDPLNVLKAMSAIQARNAVDHSQKALAAKEFAAIYAKEFRGQNALRMLDMPLSAADSTDTNLGTLAGSLVTQRTLELLKLQFPDLLKWATDFSDQPAQFNQTVITRIIGIPTASEYNTTTGWADSTATTTDVPVTINKHIGVPITFNSNILASTVRRLFEEFAPASAYAIAKALVDAIYANITDANFPNATTVATSSFDRTYLIDVGTALTLRGVPQGAGNRTALLYPTLFAKLAKDTSLVTLAAFQRPEIIEAGRAGNSTAFAIPVSGFDVHESANLPTNNGNITGFGGSRSALVVATRTPNDYTSVLPGASYGNVQMVTDPDIGVTVMLAQYVNHQLGTATSRQSLMFGTAAGQSNAGQLIKAASGTGSSRA